METSIRGLHHLTLVTKSYKVNSDFYTNILGLRRVKLTVNQDDIYHRHLFYSDNNGTAGSTITFFEWPELRRGRVGLGSPHHLSYEPVKTDSIIVWKKWLDSKGVKNKGPFVKEGRISLYLRDPDGVLIEISKKDPSITQDYLDEVTKKTDAPEQITQDMRLRGLDHASPVSYDAVSLAKFLEKVLSLKKSYSRNSPYSNSTFIVGFGNETKEDFLRYLISGNAEYGDVGIGNIHHIALMVETDEEQRQIHRRLESLGIINSGIIDRFWFKSLYFRDPYGNLLEIATKGPGYTVDEPLEKLGTNLVLPLWLEPRRKEIEAELTKLDEKNNNMHETDEDVPDLPEVI